MLRKSPSIKADIAKIKKLQALQEKATDKLNRITEKAASKTPKKKKVKPASENKAKTAVKKGAFRHKVLGKKSRTEKRRNPLKPKNTRPGKKSPASRTGNDGIIFRHFGVQRGGMG
jgi:hypothetical protein